MNRYALKVEYHGAPFAGWQRQADQPQFRVRSRMPCHRSRAHTIAAAGRTDAGVHATAQVAHCDMEKDWDPFRLSEALNYHLKPCPCRSQLVPKLMQIGMRALVRWNGNMCFACCVVVRPQLMMRACVAGQSRFGPRRDARGGQSSAGLHDFTTFDHRSVRRKARQNIDELTVTKIDACQVLKSVFSCGRAVFCTIKYAVLSGR